MIKFWCSKFVAGQQKPPQKAGACPAMLKIKSLSFFPLRQQIGVFLKGKKAKGYMPEASSRGLGVANVVLAVFFVAIFIMTSCANNTDQPVGDDPVKPQDVYTRKKPANWRGKENTHVPKMVIYKKRKQNIVVTVPLKDPSPRHYIEKIAIYDKKNKKDLAVKVFSKHAKYFEAIFSLHPVPSGEHIMVYAKCNLHDLWMAPLSRAKRK